MRNIEKYKDEIFNRINECELAEAIYFAKEGKMADCDRKCKLCRNACVRWLLEEYKESILDDVERKFLSAVIRPFRKMIAYIVKAQDFDGGKQCIRIILQNGDGMHFPYLDDDAMYKGMEVNKEYSLEELGL